MAYLLCKKQISFVIAALFVEYMECIVNMKTFRKMPELSDVLPTTESCYVSEFLDTRLIECSLRCSMSVCAGVFYNDHLKSCKLLRRNCNENLLYSARPGWNFLSDISGCDEGWVQYRDHCYSLNMTATTWDNAALQCHGKAAYLVEIESKEENEWIKSEYEIESFIWTGGTDAENEGMFIWSNSRRGMNYTNWMDGEPNNALNNEDCLSFPLPMGNWYDAKCTVQFPYLCEKTF